MSSITHLFNKSVKVIKSCGNTDQLAGGIKYCKLFKEYCIKSGADEILTKLYHDKLIDITNDKVNEFNRN